MSRLRFLLAAVLCTGIACAQRAASRVQKIGAFGMTVANADRAARFYADVLTFQKVSDVEVAGPDWERAQGIFGLRMRVVRMRLGSEEITLTEYLAPKGRPFPEATRSNDLWFQHVAIVVSDMQRAYKRLRAHSVEHASPSPQRLPDWNPHAAGIEAFYFRDPDGHFLELLHFPKDKGEARWQATERLFLGVDHSAIVVRNTGKSLRFYRDTLGLRVAGHSENWGPEQERLNNVFGARLRITLLRAKTGPGIELLEYLAPRDGKPRPSDARPNDLLYWQTELVVAGEHPTFHFVATPERELGFAKSALASDPDGHVMQLIERREP